jgi:hypothetical protein
MQKLAILIVMLMAYPVCVSADQLAENLPESAPAVTVSRTMTPPRWALNQRLLLRENTRALRRFYRKYWDERGYLKCLERWSIVDGVDDVMETCGNWPLLYALGADDDVLEMYKSAFDGHIQQYTTEEIEYAPDWGVLYKEFITAFDWQHNSEQYGAFNQLTVADPADEVFSERMHRFAGFYLNEGLPEGAEPNYDSKHRIIRSAMNGSRGALLEMRPQYWGHKWQEIGQRERMDNWTRVQGDMPLNLLATTLPLNAYVISGEEKYRAWLLEYVDAWCRRAAQNDDIFPGNVGLSGEVGEHWEGRWWDCWQGRWNLFRGIRPALENAMLLTGDERYMEVLRRQIRALYARQVEIKGKKYPPAYYNENGWGGRGRYGRELTRLYLSQFREEDLRLIENDVERRVQKGFRYRTGYFYHVDDYAWLYFVLGRNPDFPQDMFESDMGRIRRRVRKMRADDSKDWERRSDHAQALNPVSTHTLFNLICGGIGPLWQSTALLCEVFPYDPARGRPGLPPDVSVMVDSIEKNQVGVQIVNTSQTEPRVIVLQAGAYGENRWRKLRWRGEEREINSHYCVVRLQTGAGGRLVLERERLVRRPVAGLPWVKVH